MIAYAASGIALDTDRPDPGLIRLEDLATALGRLPRWRGAIPVSVAQHSCGMAACASTERVARWALLHDAPEAYLGISRRR